MNTCIEIKSKDGTVYRPMIQFDYDDIRKPIVHETDDKIIISYYKAEEYWEIDDAWLIDVYCNIIGECRGYFSQQQIKSYMEDERDMPDFFTHDEDGERTGFKLPDGYPVYAIRYLAGYAHSNVVWHETTNVDHVDAVLWVKPEYIEQLRKTHVEPVVHDMIKADLDRCHRLLDGDQLYTHNTIEIDKKTGESDLMGMVTYLFYEHCTDEQLHWQLDGEPCEYKLLPLSEIITSY